jgi:hypothetical protein
LHAAEEAARIWRSRKAIDISCGLAAGDTAEVATHIESVPRIDGLHQGWRRAPRQIGSAGTGAKRKHHCAGCDSIRERQLSTHHDFSFGAVIVKTACYFSDSEKAVTVVQQKIGSASRLSP